jgi:CelD/BcsL family acetyltransferase involved in cellulose biosynthesis
VPDIYEIDPIEDPRWRRLVLTHPRASVFHSPQWLAALHRTYGFKVVALTTSPATGNLENGLVVCHVNSWLTGNRVVSLPFSDHCDPLSDDATTFDNIISAAVARLPERNHRYIEIRPVAAVAPKSPLASSSAPFYLHRLDLRPGLGKLFDNCHKDSIQRKIRRADREQLVYEEGRSDRMLEAFYGLLVVTRRRHRLPPQPVSWFRNLIATFGDSLKIRVAFKSELPIAAILTLQHKDTLVYKYGCSDSRFHNLGCMQFLFWHAIEDAKREGLETLDLGRSDIETPGLTKFKDRWGADRSILIYTRIPSPGTTKSPYAFGDNWKHHIVRDIVSRLPDPAFRSSGSILYKHIG